MALGRKTNLKKLTFILLTLILVSTINLSVYAQDNNFVSKQRLIEEFNLKKSFEIIDQRSEDITGDNINDQIFLIGDKPGGKDSLFYAPLKIIVYDIFKKNFHITEYSSLAGYEPQLGLYEMLYSIFSVERIYRCPIVQQRYKHHRVWSYLPDLQIYLKYR